MISGLSFKLQSVAQKVSQSDSLDLDELDSLFNNLYV